MSCKKLINNPQSAVDDSITGLVLVNNNLTTTCNGRVVIRRDVNDLKKSGKVAIVTGGGSGHEPAWAGTNRFEGRRLVMQSSCLV